MIGFEISKRWTSRRCQKKIMLDLIRHFFTNNAISEVIRLKMSSKGDEVTLKEGIMQRYCVLDSDIELGQLSYSSRNYEQLHSLRVKLRNYNISAMSAENHFTDPHYPKDKKLADLDDILTRSIRLTNGFISFAKKRHMRLDENVVRRYIRDYYMDEDRIPKWQKKGKLNNSIKIPLRKPGTERAFYDDETYELMDIEDLLIRERYSYVVLSEPPKVVSSKKTKAVSK